MREVFVDTSHFVASVDPTETLHQVARKATASLRGVRLVTTDAVLAELLSFYARRGEFLRHAALRAVDRVRQAAMFETVPFDRDGFERALERYRERLDKEYSLIDCHSMLVMEERGIKDVLTADANFKQAGFTCLLPLTTRRRS